MSLFRLLYTALLGSYSGIALAQQLTDAYIPMSYPGLGDNCLEALNTSVSCPAYLSPLSVNGAILNSNQTEALCVPSCRSSLSNAREKIAAACTGQGDNITFNDIAYPATFITDNYIFTYDVSCMKDSDGAYCDPQILNWNNNGGLNSSTSCSDCWLKSQHASLNNPLGFDENAASLFSSLTSSCKATAGYEVTSPTAYVLNPTATGTATSVPTTASRSCPSSYTVQAGDTCNSVAEAMGVSTYNLLHHNNLDLYCRNFATTEGSTLCVPTQCKIYTWQAIDSCESVVSNTTGMTIPQFLAWNPNFNSLCQNSLSFVGYKVCLSNPGGSSDDTAGTGAGSTGIATAAQPAPSNALPESNKPCASWYTVIAGDDCGIVSVANAISLVDFLFLNPEINQQCTNLQLGVAYCVQPVGSIDTYEGYTHSTTARITVAPATFSSVNTIIPTRTNNPGFKASSTSLPMAPGTDSDCKAYRNFDSQKGINSCSDIASLYLVSTDNLLEWNPSLKSDMASCALESGHSYCVSKSDVMQPPFAQHCLKVNGTVEGTIATCDCYTIVKGYEVNEYLCSDLQTDYSVTSEQLITWNPWLGSDCDTNLYAGLVGNEKRSICIGVNATGPHGTASKPPTSTPPQTGTATSASMGPTQTGIAANCRSFHTVTSDDTCYDIEMTYDITFEEFLSWNPSIGSNCESLWLGYAYCVSNPSSASTSGKVDSSTTASTGPASSTSCTVDVTFQTTHTTEWGESVWVVGSLKELGEWSIDGAFMLTGSSQGSTTAWSGTISLPANQGVGFKFVKLQVDGTSAWEADPNRGLDTPSCGESGVTAGGSWHGEDSEPSEPSCEAVDVTFEVRATTEYGEGIFVVGSATQLGEWDTTRAIALSPDNYPLWKQSVSMPLGQEGQFKYVKQQLDGSFLWEADPNREFVAPDSCQPVATREDTWQN